MNENDLVVVVIAGIMSTITVLGIAWGAIRMKCMDMAIELSQVVSSC